MGRLLALLAALIIGSWIAWSDQKTPESAPLSTPATAFAGERAFSDVNFLGAVPHPIASVANANVRDAIVGRMLNLGLSPQVRPGVGVRANRYNPNRMAGGVVENIVGVLPGRDRNAPAVALMAHYDSVPGSPGAADDLIGVATALEAVRAIKARGQPYRDVMVVLTDGEEAGLLGANHFFQRDPLSKHVGLVLNLEARGSSGRVQMFQTSPDNGQLIRLFQQTARRPASSSLAVMLYKQLPNDTDLTETLRAGVDGLNYAIIGRQFDYHSPTATPENLDRGSLQDMGNQALSTAAGAAFATRLPGHSPDVVYSNLFGDTLIAYPPWVGWLLILAIVVFLLLAIRWARHSGSFPATDIAKGAGALLFAGLATAAVLEFARRLTGCEFGYLEQRFLLAQALRWEWAVMLTALGVLMLSAAELARARRWVAALPVVAGVACSAFGGGIDWFGLVPGLLAGLVGVFTYGRPVGRKGAWAGALCLGLLLTIVTQVAAPEAAYVFAWPMLLASASAAATALSARHGVVTFLLLVAGAAASLGWQGGLSHFAFEGLDMMAQFAIPMITAGLVLWPLAQPDVGVRPAWYVGVLLLMIGLGVTLAIRSEDPWTPRTPQVSYVVYQVDQDTGRAWRVTRAKDRSAWADTVVKADGGEIAPFAHWAWAGDPMLAAPARPIAQPAPAITLTRLADGSLDLAATPPAGARTLALELVASRPGRLDTVGGVPMQATLVPGKPTKLTWASSGAGVHLLLRPSAPGRLDVRYAANFDAWPAGATPLPQRPSDLAPWGNSDSLLVTGTRAFTW